MGRGLFDDRPGGFEPGDRVKIREGAFENFEGVIESIDTVRQVGTLLLTIYGQVTPIDVELKRLEKV